MRRTVRATARVVRMSLPTPDLDDVHSLRARLRGHDPTHELSPPGAVDDDPWEQGRLRWAVPGHTAVAVGVVLLLLVALLAVLLWRDGPGELVTMPDLAPTAATEAPAGAALEPSAPGDQPQPAVAAATPAAPETMLVHVVGQVREPGVVGLPPGARVADAIEAAGGATRKGDLSALNLAAPVVDGEQVRVPRPGEAVAASGPSESTPAASVAPGSQGSTGGINLNTADAATLDTLPGVGPVIAERIVSHRDQHGPFASVEALQDVSGIGPATFARLREQVHVG